MADNDEKDRSRDSASSRDRDRARRGDRPSRFKDDSRDRSIDRGNDRGGRKSSNCRVYVSNISYEYRWQDLKDLFREKVGDVAFVELFVDDNEKPKGCGIVEFSDPASVKKCMEVMHRFELNGRKLVIKEDFGNERDKFGNITNGRRNRDRDRQMDKVDWDDMRDKRGGNWDSPPSLMNLMNKDPSEFKWGNTFGLSAQFLESLNVNRPLGTRVFVANLDYKVDEKKLHEVFRLCGRVINVELYHDKEGNSRGFAVVEYDHPVESVQAISMLHNQVLYDRPLTVRMDRIDDAPLKLPEGLKGVGMGLGVNGEPLKDVRYNLPSTNNYSNSGDMGMNSGPGILGAMPNQASLQALSGSLGSTAAALSSVVNNPTLASLGNSPAAALQASLASVQAPFLNSSLANSLGGNLGNSLSNNLSNDIGLGSLNSQNLSGLSTSLAQNQALASLASAGSNTNLLGRDMVGNDRDYSRNDNSNTSAYLMTGSSTNQRSSNQSGNYDYQSSGNSNNSLRNYDQNSMRQSSVYNSVNSGGGGGGSSQYRTGTHIRTNGNGYSETILISNLPSTATWKSIKDKFSNFGDVLFVEMKAPEGQAIVRYASEWHAERAIKTMDRQRFEGRSIDVRFCY